MAESVIILGAGIAGLGAAHELRKRGRSALIFEKSKRWGGLCDNFNLGNFTFDTAIHLSFTQDDYVKEVFAKSSAFLTHKPESSNYVDGAWVRHPVQSNLYALPVAERIQIISGFIEAHRANQTGVHHRDYDSWLKAQFGAYFAERYPSRYTRKYWTIDAKDLTTDWIEGRMFVPKIEDVLLGAMVADSPNRYYAAEMRYPTQGGYKQFLKGMADNSDIRFDKQVTGIDAAKKIVFFSDDTRIGYDHLISSLPLPTIVPMIRDAPADVTEAAKKLSWTSVALVSLGFSQKIQAARELWFYIYDEDILPARAYWPSLKSPANGDQGASSIQFEIYHSRKKPLPCSLGELKDRVIQQCLRLGLFKEADIAVSDVRNLDFANVIFDFEYAAARSRGIDFLKTMQIESIGRFGEWKYFWSDQSMMSGVRAAQRICNLRSDDAKDGLR